MTFTLEPLDQQVMVITGAFSRVALVTAKHAAHHGGDLSCSPLAMSSKGDNANRRVLVRSFAARD
jgi:hypothetical protein